MDEIRVGVLIGTEEIIHWQWQVLKKLQLTSTITLKLLINRHYNSIKNIQSPQNKKYSIYNLYRKHLLRPISCQTLSAAAHAELQTIPTLSYTASLQENQLHLAPESLAEISRQQFDVVLNFAGPVGRELASAARLGVWEFRYANQPSSNDWPVAFWEIARNEPVISAALWQLAAVPAEDVLLKEGVFRTWLHSHSTAIDRVYAECAEWPARICQQLLKGNAPIGKPITQQPAAAAQVLPTNRQMVQFLGRLLKNKVRAFSHLFRHTDQWNIGIIERPVQDFLRPADLQNVPVSAPSLPNRNVFYADSFARQEESGTVVYFEEYDYRVGRGNISRLNYPWEVGAVPVRVLDFPFHLSYPFLYQNYCIPEAWKTKGVRMYDLGRPITDPADGQLLLPGVPAIDATLLEHEGRYWLFYTHADYDPMLNLFVAYADQLSGPWQQHPQNPVKTDIRSSRPAGPFFKHEGRLYRPAQDCSRGYGCGITISEVLTLTPTRFEERDASYLTSPHPDYPDGMHTIAPAGDGRTVVDFKRYRFVPFGILRFVLWPPISAFIYGKKGRRKPPVLNAPTE